MNSMIIAGKNFKFHVLKFTKFCKKIPIFCTWFGLQVGSQKYKRMVFFNSTTSHMTLNLPFHISHSPRSLPHFDRQYLDFNKGTIF